MYKIDQPKDGLFLYVQFGLNGDYYLEIKKLNAFPTVPIAYSELLS